MNTPIKPTPTQVRSAVEALRYLLRENINFHDNVTCHLSFLQSNEVMNKYIAGTNAYADIIYTFFANCLAYADAAEKNAKLNKFE